MEHYLYLTKPEWVTSWVEGGLVPLNVASNYLSEHRSQTFTPDENLIDTSTHDVKAFGPSVQFLGTGGTQVTIKSITVDGNLLAENIEIERRYEDGLVLCVSNRRSNFIAKKFGKLACVRILDIEALKKSLDEQIGVVSEMGKCTYTKGHRRNHFLKSEFDSWQEEFRLFWPNQTAREVLIPKGTAVAERIRCRG